MPLLAYNIESDWLGMIGDKSISLAGISISRSSSARSEMSFLSVLRLKSSAVILKRDPMSARHFPSLTNR